jgi:hypothetical protein
MEAVWETTGCLPGVLCLRTGDEGYDTRMADETGCQEVHDRCVQPSCDIVGLPARGIRRGGDTCISGIPYQSPLPTFHRSVEESSASIAAGTGTAAATGSSTTRTNTVAAAVGSATGSTPLDDTEGMTSAYSSTGDGF